jgi:hypothetical protein
MRMHSYNSKRVSAIIASNVDSHIRYITNNIPYVVALNRGNDKKINMNKIS